MKYIFFVTLSMPLLTLLLRLCWIKVIHLKMQFFNPVVYL